MRYFTESYLIHSTFEPESYVDLTFLSLLITTFNFISGIISFGKFSFSLLPAPTELNCHFSLHSPFVSITKNISLYFDISQEDGSGQETSMIQFRRYSIETAFRFLKTFLVPNSDFLNCFISCSVISTFSHSSLFWMSIGKPTTVRMRGDRCVFFFISTSKINLPFLTANSTQEMFEPPLMPSEIG